MHAIRLAKLNDADILVELMAAFYAESGYPFETKKAAHAFEYFLCNESAGLCWLLETELKCIGYIAITFTYSLEYFGPTAFIEDLYIAPEYRQQGLAKQLLATAEAEARARNVLALHLEVGKENQPANRLYAAQGFSNNYRLLLNKKLHSDREGSIYLKF